MLKHLVYIIDDDPDFCSFSQKALAANPLTFRVFSRGRDFLDAYDSSLVACSVLDLWLPDMNGIEILMELRERKVSLPTIVVSAFGEVRQAVAAIKNGAFDFLEKPVNPHTLTIRILSALRESARLHQIRQQQSGIKQRYDSLTDPELKILSCLIAGKDCEFIAESIAIEPQNPYKQIMTKMEAESLVDLVRCSLINEQSPEPC